MIETLEQRIKRHEGFRPLPYKCSQGFLTIGYGHRILKSEMIFMEHGITLEKAEQLFTRDFALAAAQAKSISGTLWAGMGEIRQGVLTEMFYQMGMAKVMGFKRTWAAIESKDYAKAGAEMLDSLWHKQTPLRCEELAGIMERGAI